MEIPSTQAIHRDWHQAVAIAEGFSTQERAQLEQALSDIAHFHDNEGAALLQTAMMNNNGEKILIRPGVGESQAGVLKRDGREYGMVEINFRQIRTMGIQTDTGVKPYDVTTLITHEFYHLADNPRDSDAQAFGTLLQQLNIGESTTQAMALGNVLQQLSAESGNTIPQLITQMAAKPLLAADELSKAGQPNTAARLLLSSPTATIDALKRDGVLATEPSTEAIIRVPGLAIPRGEQDAVLFTRALVQKNYGQAVATPHDYVTDTLTTQPQAQAYVAPRTGNIFASPGFSAQPYAVDLGELAPPPVPSVAPSTLPGNQRE